jgi:hypothetical protein
MDHLQFRILHRVDSIDKQIGNRHRLHQFHPDLHSGWEHRPQRLEEEGIQVIPMMITADLLDHQIASPQTDDMMLNKEEDRTPILLIPLFPLYPSLVLTPSFD